MRARGGSGRTGRGGASGVRDRACPRRANANACAPPTRMLHAPTPSRARRLYTVVPYLVRFVDSLTNVYVRYNRKRLKGSRGQQVRGPCGGSVVGARWLPPASPAGMDAWHTPALPLSLSHPPFPPGTPVREQDSATALAALFEVLLTVCKVMSPFTPFFTGALPRRSIPPLPPRPAPPPATAPALPCVLSIRAFLPPRPAEAMYLNLRRALPEGAPESIHFCDMPPVRRESGRRRCVGAVGARRAWEAAECTPLLPPCVCLHPPSPPDTRSRTPTPPTTPVAASRRRRRRATRGCRHRWTACSG